MSRDPAVHGVRYDYGVEQDQGQWRAYKKTIYLHRDGTDSNEWVAVYQDAFERNYRTLFPDGSEELQNYDITGELVRSIDADGVATLYETDLLGNVTTTAIDMNRNGKIDYKGEDIISRTVRKYVVRAGKAATRFERRVWNDIRKDRSTLHSATIVSADGLDTWRTSLVDINNELVTHVHRRLELDGRETEVMTLADGSRNETVRNEGQILERARKDVEGNLVTRTEYRYEPIGHISSITSGIGTVEYEYDAYGNRTSESRPASEAGEVSQVTHYRYDVDDRLVETIHPDGGSVLTEYWPTGEKKLERGVRTYPVYYQYDYAGRLQRLTTWQDANNQERRAETQWFRDNRGRVTQKKYNDGKGPRFTFTPAGRLASRIWARGVVTTYDYDAAGLLKKTSYSDKTPTVERRYDRTGRLEEVKEGKSKTEMTYDAFGRLTKEKRAGGNKHELIRTYDGLGRPTGYELKQDGEKIGVRYGYDMAGRLAQIGSDSLTARYEYLRDSTLMRTLRLTDREGTERMRTDKEYDGINRLTAIRHTSPKGVMASFSYIYNSANQRVEVHREDGSYWRYGHDNRGQVVFGAKYGPQGQSLPGHGFGYGFDDIGNRQYATKLDAPFDRGDEGAPDSVSEYRTNLLNQYEQRTIASRAEILGQTDPRASLQASAENALGEALQTKLEREGSNFRVSAPVDNLQKEATTRFVVEASLGGKANSQTSTVATPSTPVEYFYDVDGNLIQDESWHYQWNGENRLVGVYSRQTIAPNKRRRLDFRYDSHGRRVEKVVSEWDEKKKKYKENRQVGYVYDGWNLIGELQQHDKDSLWKTYLWGLDLSNTSQGAGGIGGLLAITTLREKGKEKIGPQMQLPFYDGNGNVMGLVFAENAELVAEYSYGPFGELLRATGPAAQSNAFRFSSKYTDEETGHSYYGFRYYMPSNGLWLSRDPIEENGGVNLYGFVENNPLDGVDLFGLVCESHNIRRSFSTPNWLGSVGSRLGFYGVDVKVAGRYRKCFPRSETCCRPKHDLNFSFEIIGKFGSPTLVDNAWLKIRIGWYGRLNASMGFSGSYDECSNGYSASGCSSGTLELGAILDVSSPVLNVGVAARAGGSITYRACPYWSGRCLYTRYQFCGDLRARATVTFISWEYYYQVSSGGCSSWRHVIIKCI